MFTVDKGIQKFLERMGLKAEFFELLVCEDDWSFIIKLHALFEGACTHLLLFHFQEPKLAEVISRLELSNKTTGKLAFLKQTELLSDGDRRLISALSELRNSLVHDVRTHSFSLKEMASKFTTEQLRHFTITFNPWEEQIRKIEQKKLLGGISDKSMVEYLDLGKRMDSAKTDPKEFIWLGAHNVLASMVEKRSYSDYVQWTRAKKLLDDGELVDDFED